MMADGRAAQERLSSIGQHGRTRRCNPLRHEHRRWRYSAAEVAEEHAEGAKVGGRSATREYWIFVQLKDDRRRDNALRLLRPTLRAQCF